MSLEVDVTDEDRCRDCGHLLDSHDQQGCMADVETSDGDWRPCDCTVPGNQLTLA